MSTTLVRPPFPTAVDNSMRSTFRQCPHKFSLQYLHHWKPKSTNQHLQGGGAFAHGIEVARRSYYEHSNDPETAVLDGWRALIEYYAEHEEQDGDVKTCKRMASALLYYFTTFPLETDFLVPFNYHGKHVIEFSFNFPLSVRHPTTGDPILYYGRFDMCGQHRHSGDLYVVDEKTSGQLGNSWVEGWKLDSQFTGYCCGARMFDLPVVGAIIRGVSITAAGNHSTAQSVQMRPQWMIDRWLDQVERDVQNMIRMWNDGHFDMDLAGGCKMYGGCGFRHVCASHDPLRWLEEDFVQREYSPWKQEH